MYHFHLYPRCSLCSELSLLKLRDGLLKHLKGRVTKNYLVYIKNDTLCIKIEDYHFYLRLDRDFGVKEELRDYLKNSHGLGCLDPYIDQDWFEKTGLRIEMSGDSDLLREYVSECLIIVEYFAKTRSYVLVPAKYKN